MYIISIILIKINVSKVITQCCIVELYKMGKDRQPAVDLAKDFERRKCNHREAIEGSTCLREVVGVFSYKYCSGSCQNGLLSRPQ
jgi:rRNA-processing protein FCF1